MIRGLFHSIQILIVHLLLAHILGKSNNQQCVSGLASLEVPTMLESLA